MYNPIIEEQRTSRDVTDTFYGYDARLKIPDGYWNMTLNLTTDYYPLLAPRGLRTTVMQDATTKLSLNHPGGLLEKDSLAFVKEGALYYNFVQKMTDLSYNTTGGYDRSLDEKQLVSMGAYICIFPDKKYFNTENASDTGSMEAHYPANTSWVPHYYTMCHQDGTDYATVTASKEEPTDKDAVWLSTDDDGNVTGHYSYSQSAGGWIELNTVYTKISFASHGIIPTLFKQFDAVDISGSEIDDINGSKVIYALGGDATTEDYIVVIHPLDRQRYSAQPAVVHIDRSIPDMDFVIECQNRLWGCKYGYDSATGSTVNEIYCSALGDFKNWKQYLGLSTDSWAASVGSDGEWTGAINYLGYPTFFKEDRIHVVSVSGTGAHSIQETPCRGVQKGSHKSLKIVGETLYYKSRTEVMAYRGSFPTSVSEALGDIPYNEAVAGTIGSKYYIDMKDTRNGYYILFFYDTDKGIWMREGPIQISDFAKIGNSLYAIAVNNNSNNEKVFNLVDLMGKHDGLRETGPMRWSCDSGILYYAYPDNKYVTRFNIRCRGTAETKLQVFIRYDSEGEWVDQGEYRMHSTNTITIPVRPHRCDHMQIRLLGTGDIKIFSIAKILEVGSDV